MVNCSPVPTKNRWRGYKVLESILTHGLKGRLEVKPVEGRELPGATGKRRQPSNEQSRFLLQGCVATSRQARALACKSGLAYPTGSYSQAGSVPIQFPICGEVSYSRLRGRAISKFT